MYDQRQPASPIARSQRQTAAVAAPLLCAAHCIATPLLVLFAPMLILPPAVEVILITGTLALVAALLWRGVRVHGQLRIAIPAVTGALLWIGGELTGSHSTPVLILHAVGGILLAVSLLWNARLRHAALCRGCGCSAHEEIDVASKAGRVAA
jgi:hypothetical protein